MIISLPLLLKGLIIGFSIAAPVGPIGILCIKRTLNRGLLIGIASGLGAAGADAVYGLVAGLGLTVVSNFLITYNTAISLSGASFLLYLGIKTLCEKATKKAAHAHEAGGLIGAFATTFLLTITNPLTILSFTAIFAGAGALTMGSDYVSVGTIVLAVFMGSAAWWLILCGGVSMMRSKVTSHVMQLINWFSGLIIIGFAAHIIWSTISNYLSNSL